ncbi:MAG TPA: PEGA domain-containing protein [Kofleriaceae bacterium]|nr:PEGA domain-containing protein [Kofleriaceae bacterium]
MIRSAAVLACLALALPRLAHADDTAALAYQQAEQLEKQGKMAEACPLYEASYRADPQIGVLLHLANCHEQVGKVASAWAEFNDASELAHRRGDNREALAKARADALKPKLAYLHVAAPPSPPPGLVVTRDGLDITVLVGTDMPIDPGQHDITASAPGYLDFTKHVTIGSLPTTTQLAIPVLDKKPAEPAAPVTPVTPVAPPKPHEGSLTITTQSDAHVSLDSSEVGIGGFQGKIKSGGHTLRVTAPGMRPYQSEVFVGDDETRTIDVPLEKEVQVVVGPGEPVDDHPHHEFGLSFAPGEKLHDGNAGVIAYRLDYAHRWKYFALGLFAQYSSVSASDTCGTAIPGPQLSSPYDYGQHYRFDGCHEFTAGFEVYVHLMPKRKLDPYVGISPGFRFGFVDTTPYMNGVASGSSSTSFMPGIGFDSRIGLDYHPSPSVPGWAVGAFVDLLTMIIAEENFDSSSSEKNATYLSLFGGVRTSIAF